MDIQVTRTTRNQNTKRNPIARILKHFTPKRFKDKTKYSRKEKYGQTNRHYEYSDSSETAT